MTALNGINSRGTPEYLLPSQHRPLCRRWGPQGIWLPSSSTSSHPSPDAYHSFKVGWFHRTASFPQVWRRKQEYVNKCSAFPHNDMLQVEFQHNFDFVCSNPNGAGKLDNVDINLIPWRGDVLLPFHLTNTAAAPWSSHYHKGACPVRHRLYSLPQKGFS